jgi:ATP-dependent Lhr-like helicase
MQLFSVFDTPPLFVVFHGRTELGTVHQLTFQVKRDEPLSISLGGHSWRVKHVDWKRRRAFVEPGTEPGTSRWFSAGQPLAYELCQAVLQVLAGSPLGVSMSKRAESKHQAVLAEYQWADAERTIIVSEEDGASWWTFGGGVLNSAIAAELERRIGKVQYDNFAVYVKVQGSTEPVVENVRGMLEEEEGIAPPITGEVREDYKFGECVPDSLLDTMIGIRFSCLEAWNQLRQRELGVVYVR